MTLQRVDIRGNADPNAVAKDRTEAELLKLVAALFAEQYEEVRALLDELAKLDETETVPMPPSVRKRMWDQLWNRLRVRMTGLLRTVLQSAVLTAASRLIPKILGQHPAHRLIEPKVDKWAWAYAIELASDLFVITQRAVETWASTGVTPMGGTTLAFYFGRARAGEIATTQTTKAFTEGERVVIVTADGYSIQTEATWHTMRDELVCEVCAPLDGKVEGDWGVAPDFPPLHPEGRCWVTYQGAGDVWWRWQQ